MKIDYSLSWCDASKKEHVVKDMASPEEVIAAVNQVVQNPTFVWALISKHVDGCLPFLSKTT